MKASELIIRLTQILATHGDCEIKMPEDQPKPTKNYFESDIQLIPYFVVDGVKYYDIVRT